MKEEVSKQKQKKKKKHSTRGAKQIKYFIKYKKIKMDMLTSTS